MSEFTKQKIIEMIRNKEVSEELREYAKSNILDLSGCDLSFCKIDIDLTEADLTKANLYKANLTEAMNYPMDLNKCLKSTDLIKAGFIIDGLFVIGYRTRYPQFKGNKQKPYEVGGIYKSDFFDHNIYAECSFGLYMAGFNYLKNRLHNPYTADEDKYKYVKVRADICSILRAGDKFRVPEFEVLKNINHWKK